MSQKQITLMPQYYREFSCIGSDCEDSCCQGWLISIDEETYNKYQQFPDAELLPLLQEHVKLADKPNAIHHATLNLTGKRCPMLSETGLCSIHQRAGESYLSNTCARYPRVVNRVDRVLEKSLNISCPEAARVVLLSPNPMEFDEVEEPAETRNLSGQVVDTETAKKHSLEKHFWGLRIFTIQVLQNRKFTIDDRVIILGLFFEQLDQLIQKKQMQDIPNLILEFNQVIESNSLLEILASIKPHMAVQLALLDAITYAQQHVKSQNKRYQECFAEFRSAIGLQDDVPVEERVIRYQKAHHDYYKPFIKRHEYILENYLVNNAFKNLFPAGDDSVFDTYTMMVVHFTMVKAILIGLAGYHQGVTTELVIKTISSYGKEIEHSPKYPKTIINWLRENNLSTTSNLCILLKL